LTLSFSSRITCWPTTRMRPFSCCIWALDFNTPDLWSPNSHNLNLINSKISNAMQLTCTRDCINKLCGRPPQYATAPCKLTFDHLTLKSGARVTCDVGYLCANFSIPMPLCSRLRPDVHIRQTDVRHASLLNASTLPQGRGHNVDELKQRPTDLSLEWTAAEHHWHCYQWGEKDCVSLWLHTGKILNIYSSDNAQLHIVWINSHLSIDW